ncbi:cell division protein FtsQ/DivIB [Tropicimonas sp. IMCC6043]|uniref:cell division protein FtsQ/DivIB n=1 Tax=Tropicimonas sp. IMCC6043 TaxID=2510645 RepID=UPI00101CCD90|nr:cell division protein FtsQ/DivIB [Tropicimonas sp. IMCC6043]RYH07668.1 cell division protein FtsQ [Tropicimonas sp. IMCC6043]
MQPVTQPAHDPAPSRLSYRIHRWWLTPFYRRIMRIGLPLVLIAGGAGWYASDPARVEQITDAVSEAREAFEERPEFMVQLMSIEGAAPELAEAVRAELALRLPMSSFEMDLGAMRATVERFNAVESARLRLRPGGVLAVEITERVPAILWRSAGGLSLLDAEGHMVAGASLRADWPDLPIVAGAGAERAIPEALELFAAAAPLKDRLRGLVRMGERRWDVVLDRDQRLLLPEDGPVAALERLIALDKGRDMLTRDITIVDFRSPRRPTVRLNSNAVHELRNVRDQASGGFSQ